MKPGPRSPTRAALPALLALLCAILVGASSTANSEHASSPDAEPFGRDVVPAPDEPFWARWSAVQEQIKQDLSP